MKPWFLLVLLLLGGCAFVKVPLSAPLQGVKEQVVEGEGRAKLAMVDISGLISLGHIGFDRFSKEPPLIPRLKEELNAALADPDVVGLLVRIDSGGGSVTASDIVYHELKRFGEKKQVPVVACVMDKALSGGYYAALAADAIVAHPTAVVGGVGVITFKFNIAALLDKWGIEEETVKSGDLKDFWSPLRPGKPEEIALMQGITDRLHQRFIALVEENRDLKACTLKQMSRGGIFDAPAARGLKIIDEVGYLDDALALLRQLGGVEKARVVIYRRPGSYAENIYAATVPLVRELSLIERGAAELLVPSFRYQYLP
ncbi:signal peptide peptidase SppA [Trichloromonas sp.]|uniref:signal peptide peptidase SppA n=1 Tax=Trichloromonas sp. TaxID=3069249 RepID=UPI003D81C375